MSWGSPKPLGTTRDGLTATIAKSDRPSLSRTTAFCTTNDTAADSYAVGRSSAPVVVLTCIVMPRRNTTSTSACVVITAPTEARAAYLRRARRLCTATHSRTHAVDCVSCQRRDLHKRAHSLAEGVAAEEAVVRNQAMRSHIMKCSELHEDKTRLRKLCCE